MIGSHWCVFQWYKIIKINMRKIKNHLFNTDLSVLLSFILTGLPEEFSKISKNVCAKKSTAKLQSRQLLFDGAKIE